MSNTEKKSGYHLLITDNETGETVHDVDINALIGAVNRTDNAVGEIILTSCNGLQLAATVLGAENTVEKAYTDDPFLKVVTAMLRSSDTDEEENEEKGE